MTTTAPVPTAPAVDHQGGRPLAEIVLPVEGMTCATCVNRIERFLTIDTNGITTLTQENFNSSDSYGAEVVGTYRLKDKLSGFVNFSLYRVVLNGDNVDASLSTFPSDRCSKAEG